MSDSPIFVIKRNGSKEPYNIEKINRIIEWAIDGLEGVSLSEIEINIKLNLKDGITSTEIHDLVTESAANLISLEKPNYQYVAARLLNYQLRKNVWLGKNPPKLIDFVKKNVARKLYDPEILNWYSESELNKIDEIINHDRDFDFTYAGIRQLAQKYLVQNRETKEIFETPQFAYILIAACLFHKYSGQNRLSYIRKAYNYFSKFKINLPSPITAGCRTTMRSFSSCCLIDVDDSMQSIFASVSAVGHASSKRYGLGVNLGRIRAINTPIRNGDVLHTGAIPFAKVFESTVKSCHQGGLRNSSSSCTFTIFNLEIEDIIQLKNNGGTDTNRVRGLDYSITISKLFYDRFLKNENMTLFSYHETQELYNAFGLPEFDELYVKYENDPNIKYKKVVSARDIFSLLTKERVETGRIYIIHLDHSNHHSPWLDKVNMSNLCLTPDTHLEAIVNGGKPQTLTILDVDDLFKLGNIIQVLSRNNSTQKLSYEKVINSGITGYSQKTLEITSTYGNSIRCTPNHKIWTKKQGYVEAKNLKVGDELEYLICPNILVKNIQESKVSDVYDITVENNSNFYANNILVHNCLEILHPTIPLKSLDDPNGEIGVCILAALNWGELHSDSEIEKACDIIVRMLDELIDYQEYFNQAARNFATKKRSIGVGVTNLAYFLAKKGVSYSDKEALVLVDEFMEKQQYYLLKASNQVAKEKGKCEHFDRTKYSLGILPIDTYKKEVDSICSRKLSMDWEELRKDIKEFGLRHSTVSCAQPCDSSAIISNSTNGIEPPLALISYKQSKARTLPFLVPESSKLGSKYTLAYKMGTNLGYLNICAVLQKYIDMAISVNMYYSYPLDDSTVMKDMLYHYKMGGKTIYYTNTDDGNKQNIASEGKAEEEDGCGGACRL